MSAHHRAATKAREYDAAAFAGVCYALDRPTHSWYCPVCGAPVAQRKDDPVGSEQVRAEHLRAWHGKGNGPAVVTVTPREQPLPPPKSKGRKYAEPRKSYKRGRGRAYVRRPATAKQRQFARNATGRSD